MLPGCCPSCGFTGEIEAFLVEPDAKRAIQRVAALDPAIGKLIGPYLRLFAPGKRGVQLRRAVGLIDELTAMVETGDVCRDERGGVRRPATAGMWAAGIEQMLSAPPSGQVKNHHYLRAIVYGLADAAAADAERQREQRARVGAHLRPASGNTAPAGEDRLSNELAFLRQLKEYGRLDDEEYRTRVEALQERFGGQS